MTYDIDPNARAIWRSIYAARYDFGAVGAALFSLFGLVASGVASAHVVGSLFGGTYDAIVYGVALFLLAEGVAYYIEIYALFENKLRWWLWGLRYVGPLLSACAGWLAAYTWLPEPYKGFALVTTIVLPLFQWGFLSVLMDRVRVIHRRSLNVAAVEPTPYEQLQALYQSVQQQRALDDLERLREMITNDRNQPLMLARIPEQPTYPTPVAVNVATQPTEEVTHVADESYEPPFNLRDLGFDDEDGDYQLAEWLRELRDTATEPTSVESSVAVETVPVATSKSTYACPTCGVARSPQAYALAKRYDPEQARCTTCRKQ